LIIAVLFCAWRIGRRTLFFLHILQLEGYKTAGYGRWIRSRFRDAVLRPSHLIALVWLVAVVILVFILDKLFSESLIPILFLLWAATFASSRRYRRDRPKKPLVFTHRVKRILAGSATLTLLIVLAGAVPGLASGGWYGALLILSGLLLGDFFAPYLIYLAALLLYPVERRIHDGFKKRARSRLRDRPDLDVIAITGSYGKTSVKFALDEILSHRYSVLATPGSYNTPMGICKVINDQLSASHRILILEMGIRHEGDIAELCSITCPNIALVTSVGIAHLESMGSIEAIAREKERLLSFVRPGGCAVFNADDDRVRAMADGFDGRAWFISCEAHPDAHIRASSIRYGADGAVFDVSDETGDAICMKTRLLGAHNVTNILMAVAVGRIYGLRLRQIRQAVSKLQPVPHRLEVRREGTITVIDDAFNSNPVGARNAVEILGQMGSGRRVIVTPGMIELGERERDENMLLGKHIAQNADLAVLVGENRTGAIAEGLRAAEFPPESIRVVKSLYEARDFLKQYLKDGDVVLFENDLPDQFNED